MTLIILLHALFASSFPLGKILLSYTSPIFLTGARMTIAGTILLAYQYFWPTAQFRFKKKHIKLYAQIIILGIYITYILRFWALSYLPVGKTAFFYNFAPFFSSLYAYMLFGEKITKKQCLGLGIGFIGMIPIIILTSPIEASLGEMFFVSWPELAMFVAVALHSYSWIIIQQLVRDKSYSPMMVNGITMTTGGSLALITSFFIDGPLPVTEIGVFAGWLAIVIIVSNIICHNIYGHLLKQYTATFLSFAGFLGAIIAGMPIGFGLFAYQSGADIAVLNSDFIHKAFVDDLHARGMQVFVYTVNDPQEALLLRRLGVDGLISDYPDRLMSY